MPTVDTDRGLWVVRVVYDGPALSGKTTSLRVLADSLGVTAIALDEDNGRTLFFDWVDYVGGLFEGRVARGTLARMAYELGQSPRVSSDGAS